jgi:hypothetical protein
MDTERLVAEYLKRRATLEALQKTVGELKEMLTEVIDKEGIPDEKGHIWYTAGNYLLERQKSGGKMVMDHARAEQWAKDRGIWDEVKVVREDLDEDALLGWVFEHRKEEGLEQAFKDSTYVQTPVVYSFIKPIEQKSYDY